MPLPRLLVTAYHLTLEQSALLLIDLEEGICEVLRPYPGPIFATPDAVYLARFLGVKTRLEKYDREGLCWMKRVPGCVDTHSIVQVGDELAISSTGTNEVIFLDGNGLERRRWSPDPEAEADSWHFNTLYCHEGRLYASCFGRHKHFRGWAGRVEGAGMIVDVTNGQAVVEGLSGPHDPHRISGGWLVNESHLARLIYVPDRGPRETILQPKGFPRGLLVLDDHYILGVSCPRRPGWPTGNAHVLAIDRTSGETIRSLPIPYPEIGHVIAAPSAEVVESMRQEQARQLPCLLPQRDAIEPDDRVGEIVACGSLRRVSDSPALYELLVRVINRSNYSWATENDQPIYLVFQIVNGKEGVLQPENPQARLPLPAEPGKPLTFPMQLDLTICYHLPAAAAVRVTLFQDKVGWWPPSACWSPAVVPLPPELITPPPAPPPSWSSRLRRVFA